MDIHRNIPLKNYLTMRLGGNARFMTVAHTTEDIATICSKAHSQGLKIFILGGGSNSLASDAGFDGIVIRNAIKGVSILAEDASSMTIEFGAGEIWDKAVQFTVEHSLSGIEALSAIPGTVGAAPVQNIGAYGQELADTFVSLNAYDTEANQYITLTNEQCQFAYRHSIFRGSASGRYVITSVTLKLYKAAPSPPFYKALQDYFDNHNTTIFTPTIVREAVTAIRSDKLPDPTDQPNTGSFFKNAIIEQWQRDELLKKYPDMPSYDLGNKTFKIPTGWLIEQTGLKGSLLHGIRVHKKNALVLINETATSYEDLAAARSTIIGAVRDTFRITIEQEPLEI
jgi:UDP-N-acetylmuramate dehydrogenase